MSVQNFVKIAQQLGIDSKIIQKSLEKRAYWQLLAIPAGMLAGGLVYDSDVKERKEKNWNNLLANINMNEMSNLIVGGGLGGGLLGYMHGDKLFPDYSPNLAKLLGTSLGSTLGSVGGALIHNFTMPNIKV